MIYIVFSDIHGSAYYTNKMKEIIEKENPDKVILLGDLYYHGPRNPLPEEYNPKLVCEFLNSIKDSIICIKGNCDAEVDEMISEFPFNNHVELEIGNKKYYFTHGHHENKDNIPEAIDVLVYGHFHTGFIEEVNGVICVNSGSITLPKNDTPHSYLIINEEGIKLKDIDGNLIKSHNAQLN